MSDTLKLFTLQNHHLFVFYFAAATALHCTIHTVSYSCLTVVLYITQTGLVSRV